MNKGTLSANIKTYLNRPNLPQEQVDAVISACEGELNTGLREHPRNGIRTKWTVPATDPELIPVPVDLSNLKGIYDANERPYEQIMPGNRGTLCGYIDRGDVYQLYPAPSAGAVIWLDYIAFLKPLVEVTDTNWVLTYFGDLYLYGCLKEAAVMLKKTKDLQDWRNEFNTRLDKVQRQGWNQNMASSPRLR